MLDLEEKQGWRNRSVIGGMPAMAERWAADARAEDVDPLLVDALVALMSEFDDAEEETRPAVASRMRSVMAGDMDAVQAVVAEAGEEPLDIPPGDDEPPDEPPDEPEQPVEAPAARPASRDQGPGLGSVYDISDYEEEGEPEASVPPPEPTHVAQERVRKQQAAARRSPADLQAEVTILPGVGDATAEQLARLGINQVIDLLWHLPFRYDDYSQMRTIDKLQPGEQATVIANLWDVHERKVSMNRTIVQGILGDSTGTLHATWWNKWVIKQLQTGATMRFSGKISLYLGQKTIDNPVFEDVDEERVATGRLAPVYRLTEGLSNKRMRTLIHDLLEGYADFLNDPLPTEVRGTYDLPNLATSLWQVHFPDSHEQLQSARRRLAFEELFYIQLGVQQRRAMLRAAAAQPLPLDDSQLERFVAALPFPLTGAQERVIDEIRRDLARTVPMTRLVQGDVGSGKTAVAAAAMWTTLLNGAQAAMLAPTQILAEQHHRGLGNLLGQLARPDGQPVTVALLTGRVTGTEREQVLNGLAGGTVDVVVGTTALIQEGVEFNNLGLIVVDEQHRFGVEQRGALRSRAEGQPHLLVMSATPIPRSLALTVYGDLDVSRIDEMPPGRTPIKTKRFYPAQRERLYNFIRREVDAGRQAYIIYPLVEESDKLDVGAAVDAHKRLQEEIFPELRVGLLHGRLSGSDKDQVMRDFATGHYQILVSTTVIEVGIDVPNATVIVVEDADRFGLAQLHQLRGRVGRGEFASYCALISKAGGEEARSRLRALEDTLDGFALAERDLELRGPGDFFGTRQSGLPDLRIAHLTDTETIAAAREAAQRLFGQDPELARYPLLSREVERFWQGHGDVS
ncbi:MAG: ATP-dependent DNA helicase RecG [Caldilineaceae bacterium]|nr:ATP-dependent DNA helicase RecG [Caldilineaceae bacterium]